MTNCTAMGGRNSEGTLIHMTCPLCNIARLVTISMNVNNRQLTMYSCSRCETKWWEADGANVGLSTVLTAAQGATNRRSA
jgi:transposase-like protein